MREGRFPIALAPEGQVTYHMYQCAEISSGISSLAIWGEESRKEVTIVPIAIGYRHSSDPDGFIRSMLKRWESETGMSLNGINERKLYPLLMEATEMTLTALEDLYGIRSESGESADRQDTGMLLRRTAALCEASLAEAEHLAGLEAEGGWLDRLFRIRYKGVYSIHPETHDPQALPPLARSLDDFHALEAHVYLRHSQIVDVLQYLDPTYITPPFTAGRGCEYVLNLLDIVNRACGGNISTRHTPAGKEAVIEVGSPLVVSESLLTRGENRRERLNQITKAAREALQAVSEQMERDQESLILE
jgi:hypothetical protein